VDGALEAAGDLIVGFLNLSLGEKPEGKTTVPVEPTTRSGVR
jgi:hypothetical protein